MRIDVVTVAHEDENYAWAEALRDRVAELHPDVEHTFTIVDNRLDNVGFGQGCNKGAALGDGDIILFLNPDVEVNGPFLVEGASLISDRVVISGERFGKKRQHWNLSWGCRDWVCGACFFVQRAFFEHVGGFDPVYVWGWEETDLIRRAQSKNLATRSIELAVTHESEGNNTPYKQEHMKAGQRVFHGRWTRKRQNYHRNPRRGR